MALYREDLTATKRDAIVSAFDIGAMRAPYKDDSKPFRMEDLVSEDPIVQFSTWFNEACSSPDIIEPNAMCLATSTKSGIPSARMVLLKGYDKDGFRFFTHHLSRKGRELEENPVASLCIYWEQLKRSIRIEGTVKKLSDEVALHYFHSRPRPSQIGAAISPQSQVIASRDFLTKREAEFKEKYKDENSVIPKPQEWGGYAVVPNVIEFWQGQTTRIHDRICFRKPVDGEVIDKSTCHQGADGWVYERLAP